MGWCSGTVLFDNVLDYVIGDKKESDPKELIKHLIEVLQGMDWDCESDSDYFGHPLVKECFIEIDPSWEDEHERQDDE